MQVRRKQYSHAEARSIGAWETRSSRDGAPSSLELREAWMWSSPSSVSMPSVRPIARGARSRWRDGSAGGQEINQADADLAAWWEEIDRAGEALDNGQRIASWKVWSLAWTRSAKVAEVDGRRLEVTCSWSCLPLVTRPTVDGRRSRMALS